ncbi:MAG: DUF3047 domain-containing protein [Burkholderiales bacterium]|nr:DUF3047 domain-containing protein [Burkholderiales bacterium]
MMRRPRLERPLIAATLLLAGVALAVEVGLVVAAFSTARPGGALPAGWAPLAAANIKNLTRYTLVDDNSVTVLRAESQAGASGLSRALRVNPAEWPWLRWRWKIDNLIADADLRTRDGDDFPARLYVMFDYPLEKLPFLERNKLRLARALFDPHLPAATLCYVWDGKASVGTLVSSAYTDRVKLIVVESGAARVKRWVEVERNVAADFRTAFGEDPPTVSAIAIATDTDNTGAFATTHFGDIMFYKQRLIKPMPTGAAQPVAQP